MLFQNTMDQNDTPSTKVNDCQYDYVPGDPNLSTPATFECTDEVVQQYAAANESVIDAPVGTENQLVTDDYQYNYLPTTNYYDSSSVPPQTYERLNPAAGRIDETTGYEKYTPASADSEQADQYLRVPDPQSFSHEPDACEEPPNLKLHSTAEPTSAGTDDLNNSEHINVNQNQEISYHSQDVPVIGDGYSEEVSSVPCYVEPPQETVVATGTGYSENVTVTDSAWNVSREEVSSMEVETSSEQCETQESLVVVNSDATDCQQVFNVASLFLRISVISMLYRNLCLGIAVAGSCSISDSRSSTNSSCRKKYQRKRVRCSK